MMDNPINYQTPHLASRLAERRLAAYPLATDRHTINWPSLRGAFVSLVVVLAVFGLWTVLP